MSWDNFDYNQTVRHQTLREPSEHISATTGKLCIGQSIPKDGLHQSMFHPEKPLHAYDILMAAGTQRDDILYQRQRYWIAEAIRCTHPEAVGELFSTVQKDEPGWPKFPVIQRLPAQKTIHYSLGPMLHNEGTTEGTYQVIEEVFLEQLGSNRDTDFDGLLQLVYGDQKTVSLLQAVKKQRVEATHIFDRFGWLLPIPGLFHWRMNYLDMIFDLYSGDDYPTDESTLHHHKVNLNCIQGHKSPFHHKEEVATRSFDARITAKFYQLIQSEVNPAHAKAVDAWMLGLTPHTKDTGTWIAGLPQRRAKLLEYVEQIRLELFHAAEQQSERLEQDKKPVDYLYSNHAKFIQQMEIYKSLKFAIKLGDIGIIQRIFARCCLLFTGSNKSRYAFLSLYMTWLTQTEAADPELQTAILANGLVNLRGTDDGWFEIDRLNEFFNLQMKTLMATRRTSTLDITTMFHRTALTASYSTILKESLEAVFGEHTNPRHQPKNVTDEVRNLAYHVSKTIQKQPHGRAGGFQPRDILSNSTGELLSKVVQKFNDLMVKKQWAQEEDLDQITSTPIAVLDEIEENDPEE